MDQANMDKHVIKMAALGRQFKLGDLYNYRTDHILTECRLWWDTTDAKDLPSASATRTETGFKLKLLCPDSDTSNRWEHMGLDEHLQASILAGLLDKLKGASHYINDRSSTNSQVTRTLICRTAIKKEHLDLPTLLNHNVPNISTDGKLPDATHVVVGIAYGAEAYCVLAQDVKDEDEDAREEAVEFLAKVSSKMENALEENQDGTEFKEQFDKEEKKLVSQVKCRVYADLQAQPVRECSLFEAYKHCLKLIAQMKTSSITVKAVPGFVVLCPLRVVINATGRLEKMLQYRDVDGELVARCCRISTELEQVTSVSEALRLSSKKASRPALRQFIETVRKFQELLKSSWKKSIIKARENEDEDDGEVEKAASIAETHPLFKISRLNRWLRFKRAELEMATKMDSVNGITFLAGKTQLEKELGDSFEKKYALVLNVPSLDERTNEIFGAMKDYVENYTRLVAGDEDDDDSDEDGVEDEVGLPWHMVARKKKQVLDKIREMADHVEKNKHLENQVQFFITPQESGKKFGCRYSVYQADNVLKDNLSQLPTPPTGLRIQLDTKRPNVSSIRLKWDYEDLGYPCVFLVEYRPKDDPEASWKQQKTSKQGETQLTINLKQVSVIEIRVAAETCIGRSAFSEVVDTESDLDVSQFIDAVEELDISSLKTETPDSLRRPQRLSTQASRERGTPFQSTEAGPTSSAQSAPRSMPSSQKNKIVLQPPTKLEFDFVTQTTAELMWKPSCVVNGVFCYSIRYWSSGKGSSLHEIEVDSSQNSCRLEDLQAGTTYSFNILVKTEDGQESPPSDIIEFTTERHEVRFAEMIQKKCKRIGNRNGMDLYEVPLVKSSGATAERFAFGKADSKQNGRMQHRTILVMGATGSGKTTLINGMINYIFDVQWEDTFRFQLIQEQQFGRSQVHSQTSKITAYDIHHTEGFRIPYSLTIVDTPGYGDTKGLDRDQEITEMVRKFFADKEGIQELDVVGFVAQASLPRLTPTQIYIFDSVLSIFGKDVKENINFLLTFADSQIPPVLSAIGEAGLPCPIDAETGNPLHHKFNNSGFFCSSRESGPSNTVDKFNRFFWKMGMDNFKRFFNGLATMQTKSLSLTKQVLEERKQLEATVDGLQPLIKTGLAKMEEMRKINQMINNSKAQIEANENVEFEVEVTRPKKVEIPPGQYLTNCNKCYVTCHNPCAIPNDDGKMQCWAMDFSMPGATRSCRICPEKCIWNMHANQPYSWEYVKEKQATSSDAIKAKYETELKRKLSAEELIKMLKDDLKKNEQAVLERVDTVSRCIKRLDEIALRPNPFSTPQYIDLIIDAEQQEKRLGFQERIESLKSLRQMAVITTKIKNKESLLSPDRIDDLASPTVDDDEDGLAAFGAGPASSGASFGASNSTMLSQWNISP